MTFLRTINCGGQTVCKDLFFSLSLSLSLLTRLAYENDIVVHERKKETGLGLHNG